MSRNTLQNTLPPVLQQIITSYLGPESCYVYNLVSPHPLLAAESRDAKPAAVILYTVRTQWMEALARVYDEKYMSINVVLQFSAKNGYIPAMEFAEIRGADAWGVALYIASAGGHVPAMEFAVVRGANDWNFALYEAAKGGHVPAMEYLAARGAKNWNCALQDATRNGHVPAMEYAASRGASTWDLALYEAAKGGHVPAMEYAASHGADNWNDALHHAKNAATRQWLRRRLDGAISY